MVVATCTEEEWEEEWGICIKLDPSFPEDVFGKGSGENPRAFVFLMPSRKPRFPTSSFSTFPAPSDSKMIAGDPYQETPESPPAPSVKT